MQVQIRDHKDCDIKRDMDLIREILLAIENDPRLDGTRWIQPDARDSLGIIGADHSEQEVAYHLTLLVEAGLVRGNLMMDMPAISKLTWQGHEFLENIKDDSIWSKTKSRLRGLPGVALAVIGEIATAEIKKHVGLP